MRETNGDSFARELALLRPALLQHARSFKSTAADREDLVQDTMERAWAHREYYAESPVGMKPWCWVIMKRLAIRDARNPYNRNRIDDPMTLDRHVTIAFPVQDFMVELGEIAQWWKKQTPNRKRALSWVVADFDPKEAAERYNIPQNTAKTQIFKARECLRAHFRPDYIPHRYLDRVA